MGATVGGRHPRAPSVGAEHCPAAVTTGAVRLPAKTMPCAPTKHDLSPTSKGAKKGEGDVQIFEQEWQDRGDSWKSSKNTSFGIRSVTAA